MSGRSLYSSAEQPFVARGPLERLCRVAFFALGQLERLCRVAFFALGPLVRLCRVVFCCIRATCKPVQSGPLLHVGHL